MVGKAEIVVGREIDDFAAVDQQCRALVAFDATQRTIEAFVTQAFKLCLKKTRIHARIIMYPFMASLSKGSVNLQSCSLGSAWTAGIQVHMDAVRALRVKLRSLWLTSFSSSAKRRYSFSYWSFSRRRVNSG